MTIMREGKFNLFKYPEIGVPYLWPFSFFAGLEEAELDLLRHNIKYLKEVENTQIKRPKPEWTTKNKVIFELHTLKLRDFSTGSFRAYTLILSPVRGSYLNNSGLLGKTESGRNTDRKCNRKDMPNGLE